MSETPVCEVCGRAKAPSGGDGNAQCWREFNPSTREALECYRLGYERARAALSAAEKERDEARRAAKIAQRRAQSYESGLAEKIEKGRAEYRNLGRAHANAAARMYQERAEQLRKALERWQSAWGNGIGEEADAHESAKDLLATLELASAASEAPAAPKALSESRPLDPPETA